MRNKQQLLTLCKAHTCIELTHCMHTEKNWLELGRANAYHGAHSSDMQLSSPVEGKVPVI